MRVKINRNVCPAHLAFCERCLGRFLLYPLGYERRCFEMIEDDGRDELTIELHTGDEERTLILNADQRRLMAGEGWSAFVDFPVAQYRNGQRSCAADETISKAG
jgi:hypothetical protein